MKKYSLIVGGLLVQVFLLFFLAPRLASAKSDLGVIAAVVIVFFVAPFISYLIAKKIITRSSKK